MTIELKDISPELAGSDEAGPEVACPASVHQGVQYVRPDEIDCIRSDSRGEDNGRNSAKSQRREDVRGGERDTGGNAFSEFHLDATSNKPCKLIVLGNEKGGSGKSTTVMHVAVALLRLGKRVGTIDLDARQGTLTRYLANRFSYITRTLVDLPAPRHMAIEKSTRTIDEERRFEESGFLDMAIHELSQICDYIIIDTPGSDTYLNRLAHRRADILITPLNDSLIDLDVLARLDPDNQEYVRPSFYSAMVMELQSRRQREGKQKLDWIVMRNRLSPLQARNKRDVANILTSLSPELNFRLVPGFGERVIFRELFLDGLTLMDLKETPTAGLTMSRLTARQEVRTLIHAIISNGASAEQPRDKAPLRGTKLTSPAQTLEEDSF